MSAEALCAELDEAMAGGGRGLAAADQLCRACVELLGVDGAAISYVDKGSSRGTLGSSGQLSRRLDELQFTYGEGPCLDAVSGRAVVLVPDLTAKDERRWPTFTRALLDGGMRAVFAAPVAIAADPVGALDLFRRDAGPLSPERLAGFQHAAGLAALPLLDLIGADADRPNADSAVADRPSTVAGTGDEHEWSDLASLECVEVYQATGMIMAQLDIGPAEALVRLRAHAYAHDQTASAAAWAVINRAVSFVPDGSPGTPS